MKSAQYIAAFTPFMDALKLNHPKTVRAWYMYDWANSVYSLVISSAIFPVYFKAVTTIDGVDTVTFLGFRIQNSNLYSYAIAFSFLIVAAIIPLLGGMADYSGKKKSFMKIFVVTGALSCMGLYFFTGTDSLWVGILFSMTASIGYSGSLVFYDAFLPEIVTADRLDATSAKGYSMGYYGSVILMVTCLVLITTYRRFGFPDDGAATRFCFLLVGLWWIGFSLIPFNALPSATNNKSTTNLWTKGYAEIRSVWNSLAHLPDLRRFLIAYFFYNMGVQTVMYLAALFGTDVLRLADEKLILTILIIQLVGSLGAMVFARLSALKGNRFSLLTMIGIWVGICVAAYFINSEVQFYVLAAIVGLVMGGIQALSRATYSKLLPENTIAHASYFSFYDVTFNLSVVFGTFSYGLINQLTGSMRYSALGLALYFVVGMILLLGVRSMAIRTPSTANA